MRRMYINSRVTLNYFRGFKSYSWAKYLHTHSKPGGNTMTARAGTWIQGYDYYFSMLVINVSAIKYWK